MPTIQISQPTGGWTVDRMLSVEGSISDRTVDPVILSINGDRYLLRTNGGRFKRKFPAASGRNVVTVLATNIPSVPLKVILTSDTDGVYTDLHIYEPTDTSQASPDGKLDPKAMAHVYWANTASPSGGTFFLNEQGGDFDQPGYGPYLYVHRAPPKGVFLIATNYWPSGDKAHTLASLNLTLFEGTPQEIKKTVRVPLATPGTTRVLAWINVLGSGHALVYVPGSDPPPTDPSWPRNLEEAAKKLSSPGGMDGEGGD
jgi:uncharacterized protein YfaP (DUF2135 family)